MSNMILRCFAIYSLPLILLANVAFASQAQWSVLSWLSSSVCTLIVFPSNTQQLLFLGLDSWQTQTDEKLSDEFNLFGNRFWRVLNFFPTPVPQECQSQDGRRGIWMKEYECRIRQGKSNGRCVPGFGVCCIFTTTCGQKVQNNLTYVISPGFPNLIDWPMKCSVVVQKINRQVSQLRIDFVHFNIGQPNPRTGVCDEDIMEIRNGKNVFQMCGWNSGQHLYIDFDGDDQSLTLDFRLPSNLRSRMWEMRLVQLCFAQRAPTGCLQYFQGSNGTLKTFNFLSNGRYLADQDYLMCIHREREMCGISYTPCSPDSFRIGPPRMLLTNNTNWNGSSIDEGPNANSTTSNTTVGSTNGTDIEGSGSNPMEEAGTSMNTSNTMEQEVGSSNGAVYGQERCRDRVLIPCDFEEFITPGNNEAGVCNLERCGNSLCDRNELDEEGNCRVETWATPFRIRVAFGPGQDTGTTLEDNIGMCLVYEQLPCVV
ncbi:uncharacterized protein [Bombus fervidus]|uniref:uncharacterized protein n=1 Tax=Bombus fervidus TaxID=203811 RepID=UPI003AB69D41